MTDGPLTGAARALRARTTTSRILAERAIARHQVYGEKLNAYRTFAPETALAEADEADRAFACGQDLGPLQGIPTSVKDLFGAAGMPTYAGTPRRLPPRWEQPGPLVQHLCQQLGVIVGKSHTVEFALGGLGTNRHYGSPYNPWDAREQRICGGSSSGAGVSLLEGSAQLAIGSDTTGSVRMPASFTGTVGLMVSHGRWSTEGIVPVAPLLDAPGLMALTAQDLLLAFLALDPGTSDAWAQFGRLGARPLASARIGVPHVLFWDDCSRGIAENVESALAELERAGAVRVAMELPDPHAVYDMFQSGHLSTAAVYGFIRSEFPEWWDTLDPNVRERLERHGATLPAHEYICRLRKIEASMLAADIRLAGVDAIALPTVSVTPARVADLADLNAYLKHNLAASRNSAVIALYGLTAISLPIGLDAAGMPVGLQLAARHGHDDELLALSLACERVLGTRPQRLGEPPLLAGVGQ